MKEKEKELKKLELQGKTLGTRLAQKQGESTIGVMMMMAGGVLFMLGLVITNYGQGIEIANLNHRIIGAVLMIVGGIMIFGVGLAHGFSGPKGIPEDIDGPRDIPGKGRNDLLIQEKQTNKEKGLIALFLTGIGLVIAGVAMATSGFGITETAITMIAGFSMFVIGLIYGFPEPPPQSIKKLNI